MMLLLTRFISKHKLFNDGRSATIYKKKLRHRSKTTELNSEEPKMVINSMFITSLFNHVELTCELVQQLESCGNNRSQ